MNADVNSINVMGAGFFLTSRIDQVPLCEAKARAVGQHLVHVRVGEVGELHGLVLASNTARIRRLCVQTMSGRSSRRLPRSRNSLLRCSSAVPPKCSRDDFRALERKSSKIFHISTAYTWCSALLESADCPTLPYDGHRPYVQSIKEAIGLLQASDDIGSSTVALMSVESETFVLEDPLPAVILPPGTSPAELAAGDDGRRHLFLAIRPRQRLLDQYRLNGDSLSDTAHVAGHQ